MRKTAGFGITTPVNFMLLPPPFIAALARAAIFAAICVLGLPAFAQTGLPGSRSYVTPFPQTERYQAVVLGDNLAMGLASGLEEAFKSDGAVRIINKAEWSGGLNAWGAADIAAELDKIAEGSPFQIAVIMLGRNDTKSFRVNGREAKAGTPLWRDAYGKQIDRLIKKLKSMNAAIYWVSMPVMSSPASNEAMETVNEILRQRTFGNGVRFIDIWGGFTDQFGAYTPYGPDITGQSKRLRESDGVSFTAAGNRKLANYVELVLRNDLKEARTERNAPLAGDLDEQRRLIPGENPQARAQPPESEAPEAGAGGEETVEIRPGQPGSAAQNPGAPQAGGDLAQRGAGGLPGAAGELIAGDIDSGVTALASVSPASDLSLRAGQGRVPPSEQLHNKVLIKGEYLPPKPGRADDYEWRPEQSGGQERQ